MASEYAGVENSLFIVCNTQMLIGDVKDVLEKII